MEVCHAVFITLTCGKWKRVGNRDWSSSLSILCLILCLLYFLPFFLLIFFITFLRYSFQIFLSFPGLIALPCFPLRTSLLEIFPALTDLIYTLFSFLDFFSLWFFSASMATSEKGVLEGRILSLHDPCVGKQWKLLVSRSLFYFCKPVSESSLTGTWAYCRDQDMGRCSCPRTRWIPGEPRSSPRLAKCWRKAIISAIVGVKSQL